MIFQCLNIFIHLCQTNISSILFLTFYRSHRHQFNTRIKYVNQILARDEQLRTRLKIVVWDWKKAYGSMPNITITNYEFGIKSPNSTTITTYWQWSMHLQEEIVVKRNGLAAVEDKPKRRSLYKRFKRFMRRMFCCNV